MLTEEDKLILDMINSQNENAKKMIENLKEVENNQAMKQIHKAYDNMWNITHIINNAKRGMYKWQKIC